MGDRTKLTVKAMTKADIEEILKGFESQYQMSSDSFYVKYNRGELGAEDRNYVRWAAYYDMAARARLMERRATV